VTIELTTRRATNPLFSPIRSLAISRADFSLEQIGSLLCELAEYDDIRITFAGAGDHFSTKSFPTS
jgi:hypothetical protein